MESHARPAFLGAEVHASGRQVGGRVEYDRINKVAPDFVETVAYLGCILRLEVGTPRPP